MSAIDGATIKKTVLEVIDDLIKRGTGYFQSGSILNEAASRLGIKGNLQLEQALLTVWSDLFRSGYLAWGYNLSNEKPPFCHVTEHGRRFLQTVSRDPGNPDGYLAHLRGITTLNDVAMSYLREGLETYNSNCFKATAVMVGSAAESVSLELRETLVDKMNTLSIPVPKDLSDWRIKRVLDAIYLELEKKRSIMPKPLYESLQAYWPAFTQQIRSVRNEAGHPVNIDPVSPETVHGSLLILPELCRVADSLKQWIIANYK